MFLFQRMHLPYTDHPYQHSADTERRVELSLGKWFLDVYKDVLEIGCVMPYYMMHQHTVIDLHDPHPQSTHQDIRQTIVRESNVLSISTLEHVGMGEYGEADSNDCDAVTVLKHITHPDNHNKYLITIPLGYHPRLDKFILGSNLTYEILMRQDPRHNSRDYRTWITCNPVEFDGNKWAYNRRIWCANAIVIVFNL